MLEIRYHLDILNFVNRFSLLQHLPMENAEYSQLLLKELMQGMCKKCPGLHLFLHFIFIKN